MFEGGSDGYILVARRDFIGGVPYAKRRYPEAILPPEFLADDESRAGEENSRHNLPAANMKFSVLSGNTGVAGTSRKVYLIWNSFLIFLIDDDMDGTF